MLQSLLPKAHPKFEALPLLGPVIDGFDDWLAANGYTPGSRKFAIRTLIHADTDLRGRGVRDIHKLSRATLYDSWTGSDRGLSQQRRNGADSGEVSELRWHDRYGPD